MREFLVGKTGDDQVLFLIEWDKSTGEATINVTDLGDCAKSGNPATYNFAAIGIKHGIVGEDEVHWNGKHLMIKKSIHNLFAQEFPVINLESEYVKADEWCERKQGKRSIKNHAAFMLNWLRKSKGGTVRRGGVVC